LPVVQVIEATAQAFVEDCGTTKGERAVAAGREPSGVDCSRLRRVIELELVVGSNITSTAAGIVQLAVEQVDNQTSRVSTGTLSSSQYTTTYSSDAQPTL
jgi:hypothetical protein